LKRLAFWHGSQYKVHFMWSWTWENISGSRTHTSRSTELSRRTRSTAQGPRSRWRRACFLTPSNRGVALREIEAFIIIIFLSHQPRSWNGPMGPHPPPQLGEHHTWRSLNFPLPNSTISSCRICSDCTMLIMVD
jgi:hypothetical protein